MKKVAGLFLGVLMIGSTCATVVGMFNMKYSSGLPSNFYDQLPQGMQRCLEKVESKNFGDAAMDLISVVSTWPISRLNSTFVAGDLRKDSVSEKIKVFVGSYSVRELSEVFFFDYMGTEDHKRAKEGKTKGKFYGSFDAWFDQIHQSGR